MREGRTPLKRLGPSDGGHRRMVRNRLKRSCLQLSAQLSLPLRGARPQLAAAHAAVTLRHAGSFGSPRSASRTHWRSRCAQAGEQKNWPQWPPRGSHITSQCFSSACSSVSHLTTGSLGQMMRRQGTLTGDFREPSKCSPSSSSKGRHWPVRASKNLSVLGFMYPCHVGGHGNPAQALQSVRPAALAHAYIQIDRMTSGRVHQRECSSKTFRILSGEQTPTNASATGRASCAILIAIIPPAEKPTTTMWSKSARIRPKKWDRQSVRARPRAACRILEPPWPGLWNTAHDSSAAIAADVPRLPM
mmetsp:Transcript_42638/g.114391  ORF Transcript_42638/g.114391 Transcript_42638/m.114391 type:complete len:303 (-) Transcript_42638:19-927(-)